MKKRTIAMCNLCLQDFTADIIQIFGVRHTEVPPAIELVEPDGAEDAHICRKCAGDLVRAMEARRRTPAA